MPDIEFGPAYRKPRGGYEDVRKEYRFSNLLQNLQRWIREQAGRRMPGDAWLATPNESPPETGRAQESESMSVSKTVKKALSLLDFFLQESTMGLTEVSKRSGLSKATTYRLLSSLEEAGFLTKEVERYRLGLKLIHLGSHVLEQMEPRRVSLPYMVSLRDQTGEAVQFVIRDGDEAVYVEKVDSLNRVRLYTQAGRRAPLYGGASCRLLLAHMDQGGIRDYLRRTRLVPHTPYTITDKTLLMASLEEIHKSGYAISYQELELNTAELAVPLRNHTGQVIASLSIAGLINNYEPQRLPCLLEPLMRQAAMISSALGWTGDGH